MICIHYFCLKLIVLLMIGRYIMYALFFIFPIQAALSGVYKREIDIANLSINREQN